MEDHEAARVRAGGPCYRVEHGIRFRRQTGGEAMLLVPDGIVALDDATAAVIERCDGATGLMTIAAELAPRLHVSEDEFAISVRVRLERLVAQGFLVRTDAKGGGSSGAHRIA